MTAHFTEDELVTQLVNRGVPRDRAVAAAQRHAREDERLRKYDPPRIKPRAGWSRGKQLVPRRSCEHCGTAFYAPPVLIRRGGGRFCSKKCKGLVMRGPLLHNYKEPIAKTCQVCGAGFTLPPSHAHRGKTCSRECAGKLRTITAGRTVSSRTPRPRELHPRGRALPPKVCGGCQGPRKRANGKYCSRECYAKFRTGPNNAQWTGGPHVERNCETCGKLFQAYRPDVKIGRGRYCSQACYGAGFVRRTHPGYSAGKGGRREDLGGQYFRSRWEANWARYLNWQKEHSAIRGWEFEPDTFQFPVKRGSKFYTPDFKITNTDGSILYHEVKGYMDAKSATKLKRMARHHPKVSITVIARAEYKRIANLIGRALPGWELDTNSHRGKNDRL